MNQTLTLDIQAPVADKSYQLIAFDGEFDKAGFSAIRGQLDKLFKDFGAKTLVFDFANMTFINSESIGYLMEIHTHLAKEEKKLVIVAPKANVKDVFEAIGIQQIVPIYADLNEFLAKN